MDDWLLAEEQIRREIEEQAVDEASEVSFPVVLPPRRAPTFSVPPWFPPDRSDT
jgi:hypothetical protein